MYDGNNYKVDKNDINYLSKSEKVEEKGEVVYTTSPDNLTEDIEEILSNLEYTVKRKLRKKESKLLTIIAVNNYYKIGVTKKMIQFELRISTDYAEKWIYNLRKNGLIVASNIRKGHMMTYFLSNMQDYIPSEQIKAPHLNKRSTHSEDIDENILSMLFKELSNNKGVFHNFRLQTRLKDKIYYEYLKVSNDGSWHLQSIKNRVKVIKIRLSNFRTVVFQVAPNGTVEIYIGASRNPYDLQHDLGLSEFFVDLGKIVGMLETELRSSFVLEHFYDWYIVRVDYNCDVEGLNLSYLSSGTNVLQVKYLSRLYQFYTKRLPKKGLILRLEEHLSFSKPYKTLKEFLNQIRDIEDSKF